MLTICKRAALRLWPEAASLSPGLSRTFHIEAARFLARAGARGGSRDAKSGSHETKQNPHDFRSAARTLPFSDFRPREQLHSESRRRRQLVHQEHAHIGV